MKTDSNPNGDAARSKLNQWDKNPYHETIPLLFPYLILISLENLPKIERKINKDMLCPAR